MYEDAGLDSYYESQYDGMYEQDDLASWGEREAWEDEMADRYADQVDEDDYEMEDSEDYDYAG